MVNEPLETNIVVRRAPPSDTRSLKSFVRLEQKLLGSNPCFVPEIEADMVKLLAGDSALYRHMEQALFIASDSGGDKARCAALINRKHQAAKGEQVGFIGHFAAAPQAERAVQALFEQAEAWLKQHNVSRIITPLTVQGYWVGAC